MVETKRFNGRGLISLLVTGGFLVMTVTGLVLYVVPPGRVANWTDWMLVGLSKEEWGAIHISSSLLFVLAGVIHLIKNWKPFLHYLRARVDGHGQLRKEGLIALLAMVLLVWGTIAAVPPISWLLDLNETAKDMWSVEVGEEPPFGHAEEVNLDTLEARTRIPALKALTALKAAGLSVAQDSKTTLRRIADDNGVSPAQVYAIITRGQAAPRDRPTTPGAALTPEAIDTLYAGSGVGRKTLAQMAETVDRPLEDLIAALAAQGITAEADDRLKDLANGAGLEPMELLKRMLLPGERTE